MSILLTAALWNCFLLPITYQIFLFDFCFEIQYGKLLELDKDIGNVKVILRRPTK